MTQPQTTEQPVIQTPQELGMQLRMHREKKGLSIGEVSERLKLPTRQIEALETGDYDLLPETVFVRGFLRSYGRFLDVDDQLLTQAVEKIAPQKQARYAPQNISLAHRKMFLWPTAKKANLSRLGFSACWRLSASDTACSFGRTNRKRNTASRKRKVPCYRRAIRWPLHRPASKMLM